MIGVAGKLADRNVGRAAEPPLRRRATAPPPPPAPQPSDARTPHAASAPARPAAPGSPAGSTRCCRRPAQRSCRRSPTRSTPQHLRKQRAQQLLLRRARRTTAATPPQAPAQAAHGGRACRSASAADDPAPPPQTAPCAPAACRQTARSEAPTATDRAAARAPPPRSQPAAAVPAASSRTHHNRLRNTRLPQQRSLDLARLDPEPAQLDLRVRAPQKLQNAVRPPARQVPGPVHPAPRRAIRVRNKPLRRQTRTTQIAPRKTRPRNVKLARNPSRNRLQAPVQNVNPRVPDRTPNRNAAPQPSSRHDQRIASTTASVGPYWLSMRRRQQPQCPTQQLGGKRLAAADQPAHICDRRLRIAPGTPAAYDGTKSQPCVYRCCSPQSRMRRRGRSPEHQRAAAQQAQTAPSIELSNAIDRDSNMNGVAAAQRQLVRTKSRLH